MKDEEIIGKVYRHFKGNYYYIDSIAFDSETQEKMIVYKPLYKDSSCWVRPYNMFFEEIDVNKKGNITGQKYRFELVEEISRNYIKE